MGIPGLESYVESHGYADSARHPSAKPFFYRVSLSELATSAAGSDPIVVVVDLMSCLRKVYWDAGRLKPLCGGQHREYRQLWSRLLRSSEAGLRLVFMCDGATSQEKRTEWKRRRYNSWRKFGLPVFNSLRAGRYPKMGSGGGGHLSLPNLQTQLLLSDALDCEVVVAPCGVEADELVCRLARWRSAAAVLAQDSDYLA